MSLIKLELPLTAVLRITRAIERIADWCDRINPPLINITEPEPGLTVVTNEMVEEEQVRAKLREAGFKPDEIDDVVNQTSLYGDHRKERES